MVIHHMQHRYFQRKCGNSSSEDLYLPLKKDHKDYNKNKDRGKDCGKKAQAFYFFIELMYL